MSLALNVDELQVAIIKRLFEQGLCSLERRGERYRSNIQSFLCVLVTPGSSLFVQIDNVVIKKIILEMVSFERAIGLFRANFIENIFATLQQFIVPGINLNPPEFQFRHNLTIEWFCFSEIEGLYCKNPSLDEDERYDEFERSDFKNFKYKATLDIRKGEYAIVGGRTYDFHIEFQYFVDNWRTYYYEFKIKIIKWAVPVLLYEKGMPLEIGNIVKEYLF